MDTSTTPDGRRPGRRSRAGLLALAVAAGLTTAMLVAAPAPAEPPVPASGLDEVAVTVTDDAVGGDLDSSGAASYWTPERMAAARPVEEVVDGVPPASTTEPDVRARTSERRDPVSGSPRTVGKVFFTTPQGNAECSAASVNSPSGNIVITAAHCIHSGAPKPCATGTCPGAFYSNFAFVPAYINGQAPYGVWIGVYAIAPGPWIEREADSADVAMVKVAPNAGRRLIDVVGGNGLAYNYPQSLKATVWGYPAEPPYNGETPQTCGGRTLPVAGSTDASISCLLNGGASGGPWFVGFSTPDVGYIAAVSSRRTVNGPAYLQATPFPNDVVGLLGAIDPVIARPSLPASGPAFATSLTPAAVSAREAARPRFTGLRAAFSSRFVGRGQDLTVKVRTKPGRKVVLERRTKRTRGKWRPVVVGRADRRGVTYLQQRVLVPKSGYFRVRAKGGKKTKPVKITMRRCPVPVSKSRSVLRSIGCTDPTS